MTQQHPITPPPELIEQWTQVHTTKYDLARQAAQWGADQELGACCALMDDWGLDGEDLMLCRRPKPPSLKEQALKRLTEAERTLIVDPDGIIRRALEQLDD